MKTENDILLEKTLAAVFKEQGWKKKARTWHKPGRLIIPLYNLQKSMWGGDTFYENIGFMVRDLMDENSSMALGYWHAFGRIEQIFPKTFYGSAIDFDDVRAAEKIRACKERVVNHLIPFFEEIDSEAGLIEFSNSERFVHLGMRLSAREWLYNLRESAKTE